MNEDDFFQRNMIFEYIWVGDVCADTAVGHAAMF